MCGRLYSTPSERNILIGVTNACETKMIVTMNARELLHFFELRCCSRAQQEIREVACEMMRQCKEVAPLLFKNAGPACITGKCPEGKMSCGKPWR